ncbi:cysteine desulfurase family protein [Bremerella sp. T1]|uniref:cysteine desulfurase family protein n=1 Tax=Bremerella sp. TYQ1 TaxID=3119568 RepID=UPI001CCFB366|nr:cysteine desulfurase family protein [Bremerella volcania]UBM36628.1 cysteine desulfurase [Bremerella volcania]
MGIYLDNAATTQPSREVVDTCSEVSYFQYANASSRHRSGREARALVDKARQTIATELQCNVGEIVFTSGGTEANVMVTAGLAASLHPARKHVIISKIEHSSILSCVSRLEEMECEVTLVAPNRNGRVEVEAIVDALRPDTGFVSLMLVNNEVGTIQPVAELGMECRRRGVILHSDAVQAIGKIPVKVNELNVDVLTFSGHKIHGPKGIGGVYIREGVDLPPLLGGGDQEFNRRAGTENVPGIVGMAKAFEMFNFVEMAQVELLRKELEYRLKELPGVIVNAEEMPRAPHISNVCFTAIDGDYLMGRLINNNICVSSGSACSSSHDKPSHVLQAMKVERGMARTAIRFSLSQYTTRHEILDCIDAVRASFRQLGLCST